MSNYRSPFDGLEVPDLSNEILFYHNDDLVILVKLSGCVIQSVHE
jgi:hypothetical protein